MQARVHLDQDGNRPSEVATHPRQALGHLDGVRGSPNRGALKQRPQARELGLPNDRVRDQDVVDSGLDHHLGLPELRDGDPGRASVQLHPRDVGALVGLRVGPKAHAGLVGDPLQVGDVSLEHLEVDHQRGGVEVGRDGPHRSDGAPAARGRTAVGRLHGPTSSATVRALLTPRSTTAARRPRAAPARF
jgi:hypothetical protein